MAIAIVASLLFASAAAPEGDCAYMLVSLPAGEVVTENDTSQGACLAESVPAKLRFDVRRGVAVARTALAEGEPLGRVFLPARPKVLPGDPVQLIARIGHVDVRREMTALQSARSHERFFARDAEGRVVVAPPFVGSIQP